VYFREENQSWDEMFTPFVDYSLDGQDHIDLVEALGCLEPGADGKWVLTNASDPVVSRTQATSNAALRSAASRALGNLRYALLDAAVFQPSGQAGKKVAVKGALINDAAGSRLNVTSLQTVASTCSN